jgi:hypothetical protein
VVPQVIDILKGKSRLIAKRCFQNWERRFLERFDENTRIEDLTNATLTKLIKGGEEDSLPIYDLVMGVLGLGNGARFYYLDPKEKIIVMDISLFLLDQFRFCAMHRLGWVEDFPTFHIPLIDLVQQYDERHAPMKHHSPALAPIHPGYSDYLSAFVGDRGPFIRKLVPAALEEFCRLNKELDGNQD